MVGRKIPDSRYWLVYINKDIKKKQQCKKCYYYNMANIFLNAEDNEHICLEG